MDKSKICYAMDGERFFLRLYGNIRYSMCTEFDFLIKWAFAKNKFKVIIIDLKEAEYIDSTGFGLLAKIAVKSKELNSEKPIIVSSNENINIFLETMGFYDVFMILDSYDLEGKLSEECVYSQVEANQAKVILEAHESLVALNSENENKFRDVINLLKTEISEEND